MPLSLEEELAAARKTIAALMKQVEGKVAAGTSEFALLQQGVALERVVADRTKALAAERAALAQANAELRRTQAELVQAQKLEAVGRLAAGLAHEINTPVQFVSDSIYFLQEAFGRLASLDEQCERIGEAAARAGVAPLAQALAAAREEAGLDDLLAEGPRAFARSLEGLARVATIVRAMRDFARPDEREKAPADLNAALAATLVIAGHEVRHVAALETDLGALPPVTCHVGELNQVFLNLVANAADAIADAARPGPGRIRVQTRHEGDHVRVSVSDDGAGIPDAIRHRIFEPFFTTKAVGRGTGQSLAVARSVVAEKHGGSLTFDSTVGVGTTFHVRIPVAPRGGAVSAA